MLTVDLSVEAIQYAINNKINFIVSQYGLNYSPVKKYPTILVKKLILLSKFPISVFVLGSPFFVTENGVCDVIASKLFLNILDVLQTTNKVGKKIVIGRVCSPHEYPNQKKSFQLNHLLERSINNLETSIITYLGDLKQKIEKVAIVGIERVTDNTLINLKKSNIDCVISMGMLGHYESILANDLKLSVISLSFYDCVKKALEKMLNSLSLEFPNEEFVLFDSKNSYNIMGFYEKNALKITL